MSITTASSLGKTKSGSTYLTLPYVKSPIDPPRGAYFYRYLFTPNELPISTLCTYNAELSGSRNLFTDAGIIMTRHGCVLVIHKLNFGYLRNAVQCKCTVAN